MVENLNIIILSVNKNVSEKKITFYIPKFITYTYYKNFTYKLELFVYNSICLLTKYTLFNNIDIIYFFIILVFLKILYIYF